MKQILFSALLVFCSGYSNSCASDRTRDETSFQPLDLCKDSIEVSGLAFGDVYCLTQNIVLAIGFSDSTRGPLLHVIDEKERRIIYVSEWEGTPYGGCLYQSKTSHHLIILWEMGTEYHSVLDCFVFDVDKELFAYVGKFDVCLPYHENIEEDNSYPVNQISIAATDSIATFRFPHRLVLRPFDNDAREVDSVIYELDLRTDSLKIKFPAK